MSLNRIQRRIASMIVTNIDTIAKQEQSLIRDERLDPGKIDVSIVNTFHSSNRNSDVTPEELSERWCISLPAVQENYAKVPAERLPSVIEEIQKEQSI